MCNWSKGVKEAAMEKGLLQGRAEGRAEGKLANMLKVFLTLLSRGMKFDEAANIAGAETPKEIEYLREHMPA